MKISATPTKTIAIAARIQSEWDTVDFAIVHMGDGFITELKERLAAMQLVKHLNNFSTLTFWDSTDGYYCFGDTTADLEAALQVSEWVYLDIPDNEIDGFTQAEQRIDSDALRIRSDGSFCFVGYGKHTSEEVWTSDVPCQVIIDQYEPEIVTA